MFSKHQITILIVEDETAIAEYFRRAVTALGFDVAMATTTGQALDLIAIADILFLDLKLPGAEQGDLVLSKWVAQRRLPVAILSGHVTRSSENQFLAAGAWNVIAKPVELEVLQALAIRYGLVIVDTRERVALAQQVLDLCHQIKRLRTAIMVMSLALVGIGGADLIGPYLGALLGLL